MPLRADPVSWSYTYTRNFPVRICYKGENFRIIFTAGITNNTRWMHHLRENDQVLVLLPYDPTFERFRLELQTLEDHGHRIENWHILCNTEQQVTDCARAGFQAYLVNHNCFLDESLFPVIPGIPKIYDAVLNARPLPDKRHDLALRVPRLALIASCHVQGVQTIDIDAIPHVYRNHEQLTPSEVNRKIQEAKCGLCLSLSEGACYASSEYLLSGIPVVSVRSAGGRDIWYNWQNSIVCNPDAAEVADAVRVMGERVARGEIDPWVIRNLHIRQSWEHRMNFVEVLRRIFKRFRVEIDAHEYFVKIFVHKMEEFVPWEEVLRRLEVSESDDDSQGQAASPAVASKTRIADGMYFSLEKNWRDFFRCFLGPGWSGPEPEFVWSDGMEAEIRLEFHDEGKKRLYLDLAAFVPTADFIQKIAVTSGDVSLGEVVFAHPDRGRYYFDLPENLGKSVVLKIRIDRPASPWETGLSTDPRKLGVALCGIGLDGAQTTAPE